ncbi:MAG: bifunctional [glutamate--ammonia ligase]-adenylyl-L-tyrosine phosphorylase/[glutamate--ammonia-ligase] adenylyltransferase [Hydrogenophilus sp.]|nr:bifunctional [glutamate--ammonia ligase]-adenylyl-L-tyrosine phosphorylase/[glutamate--ammonia-ligase] adenylyltransferase [Hydrogenophilus sp.]
MSLLSEALTVAFRYSPHLADLLAARPWIGEWLTPRLERPITHSDLDAFFVDPPFPPCTSAHPDERLMIALRHLRAAHFAHTALRDLALAASLDEIMHAMTLLADFAIPLVYEHHYLQLADRYGRPQSEDGWEQELIVIGMGKLGGGELNVSSDIDLIFVYPEDGETAGERHLSNAEFFTQLGKRLVYTLAHPTAEGHVFRVDLRLRPHGDSGPLVVSFAMLEEYLVTQGRAWERYAWIKARPLTGERTGQLDAIVRPFVFRKYLDYSALEAVRDLHAQIRLENARRDRQNHIKLGPGGIREIEFIAQAHQLIRGGRDPTLQRRSTRATLARLAETGQLHPEKWRLLDDAYCFLRRVEHRLQYWRDQQTHDLPRTPLQQQRLAESLGFTGYACFLDTLEYHRQVVSEHFQALFGKEEPSPTRNAAWYAASDRNILASFLTELGYTNPSSLAERLETLKSTRVAPLSSEGRRWRDNLIVRFLDVARTFRDPDSTLARFLDLVEAIGRRSSYYALLNENPQALARIADILSASRWAAGYLCRHPILLDELLDPRTLADEPDWLSYAHELQEQLALRRPDTEAQMNWLREAHHAQLFRLLMRDLAGHFTVERLSDHLSALADATLAATLPETWRTLKRRHTDAPTFGIVAYGKLGGKELGYAGDLDLVFLFADPHPEALDIYCRFAQRLTTWWSARTAAGELFEIDLRLRPDGEAGLPATPFPRLERYLLKEAWTWEHQALTRARFVAGAPELGDAFEALRRRILTIPRNPEPLAREVVAMRAKISAEHPIPQAHFHIKHSRGGLLDVEFIVQYLVLAYAPQNPLLLDNVGNIALLHRAAAAQLIPSDLAEGSAAAYRALRAEQHKLRLDERPLFLAPHEVSAIVEPVIALWNHLFATVSPAEHLGPAANTYQESFP